MKQKVIEHTRTRQDDLPQGGRVLVSISVTRRKTEVRIAL